jgi:polyribonucleotide nucleotidyltransferase
MKATSHKRRYYLHRQFKKHKPEGVKLKVKQRTFHIIGNDALAIRANKYVSKLMSEFDYTIQTSII